MCTSAGCSLADKSGPGRYVNTCVVLTAAAPRLQQRFDADLKEDRVLQAQHCCYKVGLQWRHKFHPTVRNIFYKQLIPLRSGSGQWCLLWPLQVHPTHQHCCRLQLLPEHWIALKKRRQRRKSMARRLKEVFHQNCACCPQANPQSLSWPQRVIVHSDNSADELSLLWEKSEAKTVHNRSLNNSNIPLPVLLCASPSPLALCAPPPTGTLSLPIRSEQPLLSASLVLMPFSSVR